MAARSPAPPPPTTSTSQDESSIPLSSGRTRTALRMSLRRSYAAGRGAVKATAARRPRRAGGREARSAHTRTQGSAHGQDLDAHPGLLPDPICRKHGAPERPAECEASPVTKGQPESTGSGAKQPRLPCGSGVERVDVEAQAIESSSERGLRHT